MAEFYDLPPERIAQEPPKKRGASRLLVVDRATGELADRRYADLIDYLHAGDVLVLNTTKVLPARLKAKLPDGRQRELMLTERHAHTLPSGQAQVVYRGKLRVGDKLTIGQHELRVAQIIDGGQAIVSSPQPLEAIAIEYGATPLPPYIRRAASRADRERYQTVFAANTGSVAAPTASLNLTEELLEKIHAKGVKVVSLTLHVGRGTFLPIRTDDVAAHKMHEEYYDIPVATGHEIQQAKLEGRRVVAVGTTVTRALEYAAQDIQQAITQNLTGEADIFIHPGYKFKLVDVLLTNFHAPDSTVIQLAAAFTGQDLLLRSYHHALKGEYRFLSYGDSMLIV
jgi:S-adenosylmethionine:tRNA ribosyltransferase-isomerase